MTTSTVEREARELLAAQYEAIAVRHDARGHANAAANMRLRAADIRAGISGQDITALRAIETALRRPSAAQPEGEGWWCSTCRRAVSDVEVTNTEYHETCGTFIGSAPPPEAYDPIEAARAKVMDVKLPMLLGKLAEPIEESTAPLTDEAEVERIAQIIQRESGSKARNGVLVHLSISDARKAARAILASQPSREDVEHAIMSGYETAAFAYRKGIEDAAAKVKAASAYSFCCGHPRDGENSRDLLAKAILALGSGGDSD